MSVCLFVSTRLKATHKSQTITTVATFCRNSLHRRFYINIRALWSTTGTPQRRRVFSSELGCIRKQTVGAIISIAYRHWLSCQLWYLFSLNGPFHTKTNKSFVYKLLSGLIIRSIYVCIAQNRQCSLCFVDEVKLAKPKTSLQNKRAKNLF